MLTVILGVVVLYSSMWIFVKSLDDIVDTLKSFLKKRK